MKKLFLQLRKFNIYWLEPALRRVRFGLILALAELVRATGLRWEQVRWLVPSDTREAHACKVWVVNGLIYSIVRNELENWEAMPPSARSFLQRNWHCGYVRYPECPFTIPRGRRPDRPAGMDMEEYLEKCSPGPRFADYLPVHGGVTYEQPDAAGYVIGFDCNHYQDQNYPILQNHEWLLNEINNLRRAIDVATREGYEQRYITASGNEARSEVLTDYHERLGEDGVLFDLQENTQVMLNILTGKL